MFFAVLRLASILNPYPLLFGILGIKFPGPMPGPKRARMACGFTISGCRLQRVLGLASRVIEGFGGVGFCRV